MRFALLCVVVHYVGFSSLAVAALSITGPTDLSWAGGDSPTMTLRIENQTMTPEVLVIYQVELELTPAPGLGSGTLNFESATVPTSDYVFDGRSLRNPSYTGPPTTVITGFSDIDALAPFAPLTLAPGEAFDLVTLEFDDSDMHTPSGLFHVKFSLVNGNAFDRDDLSYYAGFPVVELPFANVAPFIVGSINVVLVPEPAALGLLGWAMVIGLNLMTWRRRTGSPRNG